MLRYIDNVLNKITMYRLVLYVLCALVGVGLVMSFLGILSFSPIALIYSTLILLMVSWATNEIFARVYHAQTNVESVYITALILALIITPVMPSQTASLPFLLWVAVWAMASKYIFAIGKKHLFNPAAFAVALTAFLNVGTASWWIGGNIMLLPFVLVGGLLIVRKIRRGGLVMGFFVAGLLTIGLSVLPAGDPITTVQKALLHAPLFFFAFVMLTEPLTTPPTRVLRICYGAFVGFLFAPNIHLGSIYSTPELALLVGNLFSYAVSPKEKYLLRLKEVVRVATDTYEFAFNSDVRPKFRPGQYLEWTLGHDPSDSRGNRRYFTIASSPSEETLHLGVKFYPNASSFKKTLAALIPGSTIIGAQLSGDFTMPKDPKRKLVFIAGGIGVTPFRSMVKYMLDTNEARDVTLMYSNKTEDEIAYRELFDEAERRLHMKCIYTLTDAAHVAPQWDGYVGYIDARMIAEEVPDHKDRMFYLSGPHTMVTAFQKTLRDMGVPSSQIKTDFFPGFA